MNQQNLKQDDDKEMELLLEAIENEQDPDKK